MCVSWLNHLLLSGLSVRNFNGLLIEILGCWVSENGVFAFGFLEIDGDDADGYVVGIKYNLGDKAAKLPVWTVGGGLRVPLNSTFRLDKDGRLVLMKNPSGITLWSSNTSTLGVQKASLLDNGNLVLLSSKNEVLWESFSSPTNTLLPGQSLHYPQTLRAPSTRSISSYYNFVISQTGELKLVWEHNVTYWRSHFSSNEARFDSDGVLGLYDDGNKVVWSVSPKDYGDPSVTLRHLRIDRDGNLRIYSWDNVSHTWKAVWQAVQDQCDVFGSCGLYSVCGYNSSGLICDCLYSDSLEWGISSSAADSGGSGCKKMVDLGNCRLHTSMLTVKQTVLYGLYPSHDFEMFLSETACKDYCSNDTTCIAATSMNDGSGRCTIKRTGFVSGYKTPYISAVSFLKVCSVPQAVAAQGANRHGNAESISSTGGLIAGRTSRKKLIGAIALIVLLTISLILSIQILVFWLLYHRRKVKLQTRIPFGKDAQMNPHYSVLIRLSFEEIKELTNNFSNQLGTSVFRGVLPNKTPIVAKVLKDVSVSEKEFRVTVSTLSGTHHRNLVSVKGFCFEPANKVLLYEYVPHGSLDKWLFNHKEEHNEQIWQHKLDIALGVARAVAYLHSECQKCMTHGNLKLENVLLDENLVPKVTDFGLQDFVMKQAASTSESPSERDIYMLGQMFLQIVTRKREVLGENMQQILDQVSQEHKFIGHDSLETVERIARISFWCMQNQPFLRPSIGEVVKVLEGTLSVDRPPSRIAPRHDSMIDTEIVTE
ncbi:UNVERIFIED_CONTAM: G-type lectin S-receptor-like serine/threonine-protein kinase SD3-1 [Sesamum calycinum]|uniref:Receptor-like serine/threonine-protein kinase n=1 Tax=Sesamum calycinum TaxID=2727403 RepID=A0AAW2SBC7_9LAMI